MSAAPEPDRPPAPPGTAGPARRGLGGRLLVGGLWAAFDGWASEAAHLVLFVLLARLLTPADFGLVAIAGVFTAVAANLFVYSVMQALVQKRDLQPADCDAVFLLNLAMAGAAALVLVLGAPALAALFGQAELAPILRWLCLGLLLQAVAAVPLGLLTREMRFGATARRSLVMIIGGGAVGVGMALAGYGVWALVGQAIAGNTLGALVLYGATGWRPGLRARREHFRAVGGFVWRVVGNRLVMLIDERAPPFVIGLVLGPVATGYYSIAMRLFQILARLFVVPVNQVALPGFARLQDDPAGIRDLFVTGISLAALISSAAFVGAMVIAPAAIPVALGAQWTPMVPVLQLVLLRGLVWPIVLYAQSLLYGLGQPGRLLRVNLIDAGVNLALLCALAPFGLLALAAASSVRVVGFLWPLLARQIRAVTGVGWRAQARLLAPSLAGAGAMAALLLIVQRTWGAELAPTTMIVVQMVIGALAYGALAGLLNRPIILRARQLLGSLRGAVSGEVKGASGP